MAHGTPAQFRDVAMHATTHIILVRHGETEWNRLGRLQGHLDIGLSDEGHAQAALLARRLLAEQARGERFDACYSSDLSRARQTAQPLADALGLPLTVLSALRERHYGVFQAHDKPQIEARYPELYRVWQTRDPHFEPPEGESMQAFYTRVNTTLAELARLHAGQRIVCVAHGGVLDCAYRYARQMPLDTAREHVLLNASVNELAYRNGTVEVKRWADVTHLTAGAVDDPGVPA